MTAVNYLPAPKKVFKIHVSPSFSLPHENYSTPPANRTPRLTKYLPHPAVDFFIPTFV